MKWNDDTIKNEVPNEQLLIISDKLCSIDKKNQM